MKANLAANIFVLLVALLISIVTMGCREDRSRCIHDRDCFKDESCLAGTCALIIDGDDVGEVMDTGSLDGSVSDTGIPEGDTGDEDTSSTTPACPGRTLDEDVHLNLDVQAVSVTIEVTFEGGALPSWSNARGQIELRNRELESSFVHELDRDGRDRFVALVPPGTYDIAFSGNRDRCGEVTPLPCNAGMLAEGLEIVADQVVAVDILGAMITGTVTVNGVNFEANADWSGRIRFEQALFDRRTSAMTPLLNEGPTPGAFSMHLLRGKYDIAWRAGSTVACRSAASSAVPCNEGWLERDYELTEEAALDLDMNVVRLEGVVMANGAFLPQTSSYRGRLILARDGFEYAVEIPGTGPASYQAIVLAGNYDMGWRANTLICAGAPELGVPCSSAKLPESLHLTANATENIDIPTVDIHGEVFVNGGSMANHGESRGSLYFRGPDEASTSGLRMGEDGRTGPATYAITLIRGEYAAWWGPNSAHCASDELVAPCVEGRLTEPIALNTSGKIDIGIDMATVTGEVKVNGQTMPNSDVSRGSLKFIQRDSGKARTTRPLTSTGAATYSIAGLLAGEYDVVWRPSYPICGETGLADVPCNEGIVAKGLRIGAGASTVDHDLQRIVVSGDILFRGETLPDSSLDRGSIDFIHDGGRLTVMELGIQGPASFEVSLLAGDYTIVHRSNEALCRQGSPSLPCVSQVLSVCEN